MNIEIVGKCGDCGKPVSISDEKLSGETLTVTVEVCDTCLSKKYDEGHRNGYDEGYGFGESQA